MYLCRSLSRGEHLCGSLNHSTTHEAKGGVLSHTIILCDVLKDCQKDDFVFLANIPCGGGFIGNVIDLKCLVEGFPTKNLEVVP